MVENYKLYTVAYSLFKPAQQKFPSKKSITSQQKIKSILFKCSLIAISFNFSNKTLYYFYVLSLCL